MSDDLFHPSAEKFSTLACRVPTTPTGGSCLRRGDRLRLSHARLHLTLGSNIFQRLALGLVHLVGCELRQRSLIEEAGHAVDQFAQVPFLILVFAEANEVGIESASLSASLRSSNLAWYSSMEYCWTWLEVLSASTTPSNHWATSAPDRK